MLGSADDPVTTATLPVNLFVVVSAAMRPPPGSRSRYRVAPGWNRQKRSRRLAPDMTTTVVATAFGGPEVLSVVDEPLGDLGVGDVRVEVKAVGVNPVKSSRSLSGEFGREVSRLPIDLGSEAAGVVVATGEEAGEEPPARFGQAMR